MTERLSDADLDRLDQLSEAASPGPWEKITSQRIDGPDYAEVIYPGRVECMTYCYGGSSTIEGDNLDADLEFIAFARDALSRALAELRELRERFAAGSWDDDRGNNSMRRFVGDWEDRPDGWVNPAHPRSGRYGRG